MREHQSLQYSQVIDIELIQTLTRTKNSDLPAIQYKSLNQLSTALIYKNNKFDNKYQTGKTSQAIKLLDGLIGDDPQQDRILKQDKKFEYGVHQHENMMNKVIQEFIELGLAPTYSGQQMPVHIKQNQLPHRLSLQLQEMEHCLNEYYKKQFTIGDEIDCIKLLGNIGRKKQWFFAQILLNFMENMKTNNYGKKGINTYTKQMVGYIQQKILNKQCKFEYLDRWQLIFWLVLGGEGGRQKLRQMLYLQDQKTLFKLICQYDRFFNGQQIRVQSIEQHDREVQEWIQFNKNNDFKVAIGLILRSYYMPTTIQDDQWPKNAAIQLTQFKQSLLLILRTLKWLEVQIQNGQQFYMRHIVEYSRRKGPVIQKCQQKLQMKERMAVSFNMFYISNIVFEEDLLSQIPQIDKIIILAVLHKQRQNLEPLMSLIDPDLNFDRVTTQFHQLLTKFASHHLGLGLVISLFPFIPSSFHQSLVLSTKQTVQTIPWHTFSFFWTISQQAQFMVSVTLASIQKYKNASAFLNSAIPREIMPPYFELELMIRGMKQIITNQAPLSQSDRSKYFGFISIFRAEEISYEFQCKMIELQMLFEWYILGQCIEQRNVKSIISCLIFHLEEREQTFAYFSQSSINQSRSLTKSNRNSQSQPVHNNEYGPKIWQKYFLSQLNEVKWFVGFINCLMDAITLIALKYAKSIKRNKLQIWIENFIEKVRDAISYTTNSTLKNILNQKRKQYYSLLQKLGH